MKNKKKEDICSLCNNKTILQNSHIIPKFVSDDIKNKSVTGFMRDPYNPNRRLQDGYKKYLLCSDCEQRFSKSEGLFANNIFYPFRNTNKKFFKYEEYLNEFINSISWRTYNEFINNNKFGNKFMPENKIKELNIYASAINEEFKKYILNKENHLIVKNYIFFAENIQNLSITKKISQERLSLLIYQGMWSDVYFEDNLFIILSNIGGIFIATTLSLFNKKQYKKCKTSKIGCLKSNDNIKIPKVFQNSLEYIINEVILSNKEINEKEIHKIEKSANKKLKLY